MRLHQIRRYAGRIRHRDYLRTRPIKHTPAKNDDDTCLPELSLRQRNERRKDRDIEQRFAGEAFRTADPS